MPSVCTDSYYRDIILDTSRRIHYHTEERRLVNNIAKMSSGGIPDTTTGVNKEDIRSSIKDLEEDVAHPI